jgi:hypothetical protein
MTWLASLVADICAAIIDKLGGDVSSYFKQREAIKKAQAANQTAANESVAPLEQAKTPEEVDSATHPALDGV